MRYITDENGYLREVSFGAEIDCDDGVCTEYTGTVPAAYKTIEDWYIANADRLYQWQIVDGNLVEDGTIPEPEDCLPIPIERGGTGADTVAGARNALGLGDTDGPVPIECGGTGVTTIEEILSLLGIEKMFENVIFTSDLEEGTTTINGGCIQTGTLSANAISGGTLDAQNVTIVNLTVQDGNIESLDVGKLRVNGAAISASNPWTNVYHRNVYVAANSSGGGELQLSSVSSGYVVLDAYGVNSVYGTNPAGSASWNKIIEMAQGGGTSTAVFG